MREVAAKSESVVRGAVDAEGARSARGVPTGDAFKGPRAIVPDPEVPEKARRRRFSGAYKLKILQAADGCSQPGEIGALLRREGLYYSHLSKWRKLRDAGALEGLRPKKRGPKARPMNPQAKLIARLKRENGRLLRKLEQAEIVIDAQNGHSRTLGTDGKS